MIDRITPIPKLSKVERLRIISETLSILQAIHSKNMLHRFLTTDSIVLIEDKVHLIELFMAKSFIDKLSKKHIVPGKSKPLFTANKFSSINTHLGNKLSRRDDLESLFYIAAFLLKGKLPWNRAEKESLAGIKLATSSDELFKGFPFELAMGLDYVKSLKFSEEPDYDYLSKLLDKAIYKLNNK